MNSNMAALLYRWRQYLLYREVSSVSADTPPLWLLKDYSEGGVARSAYVATWRLYRVLGAFVDGLVELGEALRASRA